MTYVMAYMAKMSQVIARLHDGWQRTRAVMTGRAMVVATIPYPGYIQ
jgi:hypothetical protein